MILVHNTIGHQMYTNGFLAKKIINTYQVFLIYFKLSAIHRIILPIHIPVCSSNR